MKKLSVAMQIRVNMEKLEYENAPSMNKLMQCPKEVLVALLAETYLRIDFMEKFEGGK